MVGFPHPLRPTRSPADVGTQCLGRDSRGSGAQAAVDRLVPMRGGEERGARESRLASGWTVESAAADAAVDEEVGTESEQDSGRELDPREAGRNGVIVDPPGAASEDVESADVEPIAPRQLSAIMLVLLGLLGGLFLFYSIGWFSWARYYSAAKHDEWVITMGSFGAVLQTILFWLASAAPVLWFLTALAANRGRIRNLLAWLLVGAVLLVPLPVIAGGN